MSTPVIPLFTVHMPPEAGDLVKQTLYSGFIGQGPKVEEFEKELIKYFGTPNVLTVNSGTSALQLALRLANVGVGDSVVTTPMTCLSYLSPVLLSDGSTRPIGQIVNGREKVNVLCLDENNNIVSSQVIGWVKQPANDNWFSLALKNGRKSRSGQRKIWITGDHKIYTNRGLKRVDAIKEEKVATTDRKLNEKQLQFVVGCLLGDGSINKPSKGFSRFSVLHSVKQKEWADLKESLLSDFTICHIEREAYKQSGPACGFQTSTGYQWKELEKVWYSARRKKVVPDDIQLTPITLATWYMDDGSLDNNSVVFCTEGFSLESVWRLFWKFVDLGFRPRIYPRKNGHGLRLIGDDFKKFVGLIGKYVPPSMRYKLPNYAPAFDSKVWDLGTSEVWYESVDVVKENPPHYHKTKFVYCLEVASTHNFVTNGIVVSNCTATNMVIQAMGAHIIWADINPRTGLIDPADVERKITSNTKAVMCVDWGGLPCDLEMLMVICEKHGIKLIEDAAHAIGAEYRGNKVGTWADFTCFSLQAIKHITTVDGGLLLTKSKADYKRGKLLRWYGIDRETDRTDARCEENIEEFGYKFHMNDVAATIGLAQLPYLESILAKHRHNAFRYFYELPSWIQPATPLFDRTADAPYQFTSSFWLFTILLKDQKTRDAFLKYTRERGVMTSMVHVRNDIHTAFAPYRTRLPGVDSFASRQASIPVHWALTDDDISRIVQTCIDFTHV